MIYDESVDDFSVTAYFTIALQIIRISGYSFNKKLKELDGFRTNVDGHNLTEFPVIMLAQIGKDDLCKDCITGHEIMHYCMSMILDGQKHLGGRIAMLECRDIPYLIKFYEQFGFRRLDMNYVHGEYIQCYKLFDHKELIEQ